MRPRSEHPSSRLRELSGRGRPVARGQLQRGDELPPVLVQRLPGVLDGPGGATGQGRALGRGERGDQGLGGERVPEGVAVGGRAVRRDDPGLHRRPQMREQGPVLEAGDGLQHGHRELAAQGGRRQ